MNNKRHYLIPIILGVLSGYMILHPLSVIIVNVFENIEFNIRHILIDSFLLVHLPMSVFFMILGAINGIIFSLYFKIENRFYSKLTDINLQLKANNEALLRSAELNTSDSRVFMRQLWPTLNKIKISMDMIENDKRYASFSDKKELFSLTNENINNLFELMNIMINNEFNKGVL